MKLEEGSEKGGGEDMEGGCGSRGCGGWRWKEGGSQSGGTGERKEIENGVGRLGGGGGSKESLIKAETEAGPQKGLWGGG